MILIRDGISKVKAMPCWGEGVVVKWKSIYTDKIYAVYVNDRLAGITEEINQKQLLVNVPFLEQTAATIEVFAVEAGSNNETVRPEKSRQAKVEIEFTKEQALADGAKADFFYDNQSGNVNYQNRLNENDINIWQTPWEKSGFGKSKFGKSDFARDAAAAAGFGKSEFGKSGFAIEGQTFKWQSEQLPTGKYKFGIKLRDELGNESTQLTETETLTIITPAKPGGKLEITEFYKDSGKIIFTID